MSRATPTAAVLPARAAWVFGYGSLMWDPGFNPTEARCARLHGHHRSLCVWSWSYRGTRSRPGLVLGLDRGGSCLGRAFRIPSDERAAVMDYLYARELISNVYRPVLRSVRLDDRRCVHALTFVVDRSHAQYAGKLTPEQAAAVVRRARGERGPNHEYVAKTAMHLQELGAPCPILDRVHRLLVDASGS